MRSILVTGGGGYVGSRLVPQLLEEGYHVRVLDWMLYNPNVFDNLHNSSKLEIVRGDLRDSYTVETALQGIDDVIHLACLSNDPSCDIDEELTRSINYDAGVQLIQLAKKNGIKRFFNASSASVYGIKEEENVTEDCTLEPITLYAKYKAELEKVLNGEIDSKFNGVTVRPATLCGYAPRQRLDLTVNIFTYQAIANKKITVFGGEQMRPNLTISDMVDTYLMLLKAPIEKINGEVFNVTAENYKIIEIANIVKETLNLPIEIDIIPTNDFRSYHMSGEKIKRVLNFEPKRTIADAILELAQAMQDGSLTDLENNKYRNVLFMKENFEIFKREGYAI